MIKVSVISFTERGIELSRKIKQVWNEVEIILYTKCSSYVSKQDDGDILTVESSLGEWTGKQMKEKCVLLFIGSCGIAVRSIAPYVTDKLHDSPVLVLDEMGNYVIPILSGHVGGANELACILADKLQAVPVITTATDLNKKFAVDLFAKKNSLTIQEKAGIARVSSKVLAGEKIRVSIQPEYFQEGDRLPEQLCLASYPPEDEVDILITSEEQSHRAGIVLKPKEYVIGMGCRKGVEAERIEALIERTLDQAGISLSQVRGLASIDLKKDEQGFLTWSRKTGIPFVTYTPEQLLEVQGNFHSSDFVRQKTGVDNVCERAALKMCEEVGTLVCAKHAENGMTIAIAKGKWRVIFSEK